MDTKQAKETIGERVSELMTQDLEMTKAEFVTEIHAGFTRLQAEDLADRAFLNFIQKEVANHLKKYLSTGADVTAGQTILPGMGLQSVITVPSDDDFVYVRTQAATMDQWNSHMEMMEESFQLLSEAYSRKKWLTVRMQTIHKTNPDARIGELAVMVAAKIKDGSFKNLPPGSLSAS